jgi:hypothetical protein
MALPSSKRPVRASSCFSLNPSNLANHHSDNLAGDSMLLALGFH